MKLALFDLDHTLLPIDSDFAWGEYTLARGWCDPLEFKQRNAAFFEHYKAGELDPEAYLLFATQAICERGPAPSLALRADFMREIIEPQITAAAMNLVDKHRRAGEVLVLVTATNEFVTAPIALRFGFDHLIALQLEKNAQGWYTGKWRNTPSFKEGKVTRVTQWLAAQGMTWEDVSQSSFYSDSMNDLPLLERVHQPVATNPDARLRALAVQRGWPILDLYDQ